MPDVPDATDDYQLGDLLARVPVRESTLTATVVLFVLTRLWWWLFFGTNGGPGYFAQCAQQGVDRGQAVYRDFSFEYPPLAWWAVAAPRLIDSTAYPETRVSAETAFQFRIWYFGWFQGEMCLLDVICFGLLLAIGRRISVTAEWVLPAAYAVTTIAQPYFIYCALDIGLLMFFLLCIECWLRSLETSRADFGHPSRAANRWAAAAYLFLGLGISFKIMPVVFVPFLLLADLRAIGCSRPLAWRLLLLCVGAVGPFLIYVPSAGWGVLGLFKYHSERGINIESTWGGAMLAAELLGVPYQAIESHVAYDLVGPWSSVLRTISSIVLLLSAAMLGLWSIARGKRFDRRLAIDTAILALVNSVALSHVYSTYYADWLVPLALLLALNIFPRSPLAWCVFAVLIATICATSSWVFPRHYETGLARLETLPVVLCAIRSACLAGLALLLNIHFFARYGLNSRRVNGPAPGELATAA
jgi:hypothetical protein